MSGEFKVGDKVQVKNGSGKVCTVVRTWIGGISKKQKCELKSGFVSVISYSSELILVGRATRKLPVWF